MNHRGRQWRARSGVWLWGLLIMAGIVLWGLSVPVYGQIDIQELPLESRIVEPSQIAVDDDNDGQTDEDPPGDANGDGCPGVCGVDDDGDGKTDEDASGTEQGDAGFDGSYIADDDEDGQIDEDPIDKGFETVFRFQLRDVDPVRNDPDAPFIHCIRIQNLGSARGRPEITDVRLVNEETNVAIVRATQSPGQIGNVTQDCPPSAPANGPVAFEAFFSRLSLTSTQTQAFQLSDVELGQFGDPRTFQVQVRTGDVNRLRNQANNHTLQLHATVQYDEPQDNDGDGMADEDPPGNGDEDADGAVDEDPLGASTVSVTDSTVDRIQNRGINSANMWNLSTQQAIPIPDPQVGNMSVQSESVTVASFTVCDGDHRFQSVGNTVMLHPDANSQPLKIAKVIVKQGPSGSATDDDIQMFELVDIATGSTVLTSASPLPDRSFGRGGTGVELTGSTEIEDDGCATYELMANALPTATRGRTVHPVVSIVAEESDNPPFSEDLGLAPTLEALDTTMLGSGILRIQNRTIPTDGSAFPVELQAISLARGLGSVRIQTRSIQFNPDLIRIDHVEGVNGAVVQTGSVQIDSREGTLKLVLHGPINPSNARVNDIAQIWVKPNAGANPGDRSPLLLQVDRVINAQNEDVTRQVVLSSGSVTLIDKGDVNLDGQLTVGDVLTLANTIVDYCLNGPGSQIPVEVMNLEQKIAANVAGDSPDDIESAHWCDYLNAADVKGLAESVVGQIGDQLTPAQQGPSVALRPWWASVIDRLFGRTLSPVAEFAFAQTDTDGAWTLSATSARTPIGGLQGRVRYDPGKLTVESIRGVDGYEVLAWRVDAERGEVRFVALAPHGGRAGSHGLIRLETVGQHATAGLGLSLERVVAPDGAALTVRLDTPRPITSLNVTTLQLERSGDRWALDVRGRGIASVAIHGYDLGGQSRFQETAQGSQLEWQPLDERTGRRLANGVYLYLVTVKGVNGEIWRSDVRKLVVLR